MGDRGIVLLSLLLYKGDKTMKVQWDKDNFLAINVNNISLQK